MTVASPSLLCDARGTEPRGTAGSAGHSRFCRAPLAWGGDPTTPCGRRGPRERTTQSPHDSECSGRGWPAGWGGSKDHHVGGGSRPAWPGPWGREIEGAEGSARGEAGRDGAPSSSWRPQGLWSRPRSGAPRVLTGRRGGKGRVGTGEVPGAGPGWTGPHLPPAPAPGFQATTTTSTASSTSGTRAAGSSRPTRPSPPRAPTTGSSSRWGPTPSWPWPTPSTARPRGCSPICTCAWAAPSSSSSRFW